ncbi:MAG: hypothetical protein COB04_17675 [Gammaproteobacteria bacterium]|nr:MAG: hypothetical protein COB04_17675 [Gammaproteobacteria bacterium]
MALIISEGTVPSWFTPKKELENEDDPTRFNVKPLTGEQMTEVFFVLGDDLQLTYLSQKVLIKYGLIGWDNLIDDSNKSLEFNLENIGKLPPFVRVEIAANIFENSKLGAEQRKN